MRKKWVRLVMLLAVAVMFCSPAIALHRGTSCDTCHTPHDSDTTVASAPLWDRPVTTTVFTTYSSGTLDAAMDAVDGIDGSSRLCMSCHDGTMGPSLGTNDVSNMHPVSFTYDTQLSTDDGALSDPAVALSGLTGSGTIDDDMLSAGKMQCASCHDIHISGTASKYLIKDNTASALCLTCHIK